MEINAKALRAKRDAMAKKRAGGDPRQKVDASSWSPCEPLNADVKTGMRPISRRAYKDGGEVVEKMNRNQKTANEYREGIKHVGALKRGGRTKKEDGGWISNLSKRMASSNPMRRVGAKPEPTRPRYATYDVVDEGAIAKSPSARSPGEGALTGSGRASQSSASRSPGEGALTGNSRAAVSRAPSEGALTGRTASPSETRSPGEGALTGSGRAAMASAPARSAPRASSRDSGPTAGEMEADRLMDKYNTKDGVLPGGIVPKKRGGRAKKQAGGPMVDPAMAEAAGRAGVAPDRLGFAPSAPSGGVKKLLGLKKGGTARKGRATGGSTVTDLTGVRPTGGRSAHAAGGKAKGKTNINIVSATGKPQDAAMPGMPAPPPPMPPGMPQAGGAPPMMPPGMPGGMPMGRKSGGRAMKSYKDMTAGSLSGKGRLQKTAIARNSMG
jgi:hypothetical protein